MSLLRTQGNQELLSLANDLEELREARNAADYNAVLTPTSEKGRTFLALARSTADRISALTREPRPQEP